MLIMLFISSNCNVSTVCLGMEIICDTWPTSKKFGCTSDGNSYKSLDNSLDTSKTSACEQLCIEQQEDGCCFLGNGLGCYWKGGARVSNDSDDTNITVNCSIAGTWFQSLKYYMIYCTRLNFVRLLNVNF